MLLFDDNITVDCLLWHTFIKLLRHYIKQGENDTINWNTTLIIFEVNRTRSILTYPKINLNKKRYYVRLWLRRLECATNSLFIDNKGLSGVQVWD